MGSRVEQCEPLELGGLSCVFYGDKNTGVQLLKRADARNV